MKRFLSLLLVVVLLLPCMAYAATHDVSLTSLNSRTAEQWLATDASRTELIDAVVSLMKKNSTLSSNYSAFHIDDAAENAVAGLDDNGDLFIAMLNEKTGVMLSVNLDPVTYHGSFTVKGNSQQAFAAYQTMAATADEPAAVAEPSNPADEVTEEAPAAEQPTEASAETAEGLPAADEAMDDAASGTEPPVYQEPTVEEFMDELSGINTLLGVFEVFPMLDIGEWEWPQEYDDRWESWIGERGVHVSVMEKDGYVGDFICVSAIYSEFMIEEKVIKVKEEACQVSACVTYAMCCAADGTDVSTSDVVYALYRLMLSGEAPSAEELEALDALMLQKLELFVAIYQEVIALQNTAIASSEGFAGTMLPLTDDSSIFIDCYYSYNDGDVHLIFFVGYW